MAGWGFPKKDQATQTSQQEEFISAVKLAKTSWRESKHSEGIEALKKAVQIGTELIRRHPVGQLQTIITAKVIELRTRLEQRKRELQSGSYYKPDHPKELEVGMQYIREKEKRLWSLVEPDRIVRSQPLNSAIFEQVKCALRESLWLFLCFPEIFTGGSKPWTGILLYGAPGVGKTELALACSQQTEYKLYYVSTADLMGKFAGEAEKGIRQVFSEARKNKPSIIFFDQIDTITPEEHWVSSRRMKTQLLVQIHGIGSEQEGVLVLAATNVPWSLDPAVRRRFQRRIFVRAPDKNDRYSGGFFRKMAFAGLLKKHSNNITEQELDRIAEVTADYNYSDIRCLMDFTVKSSLKTQENTQTTKCAAKYDETQQEGTDNPNHDAIKQQDPQCITMLNFTTALTHVRPSITKSDLQKYQSFQEQFGQSK